MKLPKHNSVIDVLGHKFKIKYMKVLPINKCDGIFDPVTHNIYIQKSLEPDWKERVFIHELIHAMFWAIEWEYWKNESRVSQMEIVLYQTLKTNNL